MTFISCDPFFIARFLQAKGKVRDTLGHILTLVPSILEEVSSKSDSPIRGSPYYSKLQPKLSFKRLLLKSFQLKLLVKKHYTRPLSNYQQFCHVVPSYTLNLFRVPSKYISPLAGEEGAEFNGSRRITDLICSFLLGLAIPIPTLRLELVVSPNTIALLDPTNAPYPIATELEMEESITSVLFPKNTLKLPLIKL